MQNSLLFISSISQALISALDRLLGWGYPILYNGIGVISILLQFMVFQMKHKRKIVFVGIASDFGWLSYFALQGDFISGTASIIGIMSKIVILLQEKHAWAKSKAWNVFFVVFATGFALATFQAWMDIFALIASALSISAFFMKDENAIRKVALLSFCAFACNSISKVYVVALIADVTAILSCIVALLRYKKR